MISFQIKYVYFKKTYRIARYKAGNGWVGSALISSSSFFPKTSHHFFHTVSSTIKSVNVIFFITVYNIPPGHNRKVMLQLLTPVAGEGDPVGLHPLLLEGEATLLEGDKHFLAYVTFIVLLEQDTFIKRQLNTTIDK